MGKHFEYNQQSLPGMEYCGEVTLGDGNKVVMGGNKYTDAALASVIVPNTTVQIFQIPSGTADKLSKALKASPSFVGDEKGALNMIVTDLVLIQYALVPKSTATTMLSANLVGAVDGEGRKAKMLACFVIAPSSLTVSVVGPCNDKGVRTDSAGVLLGKSCVYEYDSASASSRTADGHLDPFAINGGELPAAGKGAHTLPASSPTLTQAYEGTAASAYGY